MIPARELFPARPAFQLHTCLDKVTYNVRKKPLFGMFLFCLIGCGSGLAMAQPVPKTKIESNLSKPTDLAPMDRPALGTVTVPADPLDWPNWRGPEQNGTSRETGLIDTVDLSSKKNVLWKNPEAAGISTPIIFRNKLYTIVRHEPDTNREQEKSCV